MSYFWHLIWITFCYSIGQVQSKLIYRIVTYEFCKLQVRKLVLIEFALSKRQKVIEIKYKKKNSHLQIDFVIFPSNFLSGLLQLFTWCIFWLDMFIYFSKGIHRWFELSVLYKEQKTEGFSHWYSLGAFKRVSCIHQLDFSYESPSEQSNKKGASNIFGTSLELII